MIVDFVAGQKKICFNSGFRLFGRKTWVHLCIGGRYFVGNFLILLVIENLDQKL